MNGRQIIKRLYTMLERSDYDEINDDLNIGSLIEDINEDLLRTSKEFEPCLNQ